MDIRTVFENVDVVSSVAVGHDGSVHIISKLDRSFNVEKIYNSAYDNYKEIYQESNVAKIYALDNLYEFGIFEYERK